MEESRFGRLSSRINNLQKQSSFPHLRGKEDSYLMQLYHSSNIPIKDGTTTKFMGTNPDLNLNAIGEIIGGGMNYGQSEARSIIEKLMKTKEVDTLRSRKENLIGKNRQFLTETE